MTVLLGCGSGSGTTNAPPAASATAGDENPPAEAELASPPAAAEPDAVPEPAGPAAMTVEARVHGQSVPATVRVLGADGHEVGNGKAGERLSLDSGEYSLRIQISDASAMLDKPTQERPLTLHKGDDLHEVVDFPWAMVQLNVVINGQKESNAGVELRKQGELVGTIKSGAPPVAISPGRYEAQVKARGAKIDVKGMMFPAGATQSVPVNVQM